MSDEGRAWADHRAREEGVDRSELVRIAIEYAQRNMPAGWRPDGDQ
jgi:hypothetical protein